MDVFLVLDYVSPDTPVALPFMPTLYALARKWRGSRHHRSCNAMASAAGQFSHRLSTWFNANDVFSNNVTLTIVSRYHIEMDEIVNAKSKKTVPAFERESTWKGFLEYRLSDLDLIDADETVVTKEELIEAYIKVVMAGYKVTGSYKASTKTATATMQAGDALPALVGWALSANGRDPEEALKLLFYKHFTCLKEDWTPLLAAERPVRRG